MASKDLKQYLEEQTKISEKQWKRLSKTKNDKGESIRIFEAKDSGLTIETIEHLDGTISMSEINVDLSIKENTVNLKLAKIILKKYYEENIIPDEQEPGRNLLPKLFRFSFLDAANSDHCETMEDLAEQNNPNVAVTGFTIFISAIDKSFDDFSCQHLEELLKPFLPNYLDEVEESSFCIHGDFQGVYDDERIEGLENGSIPTVEFDKFVSLMENLGFEYAPKSCIFGKVKRNKIISDKKFGI